MSQKLRNIFSMYFNEFDLPCAALQEEFITSVWNPRHSQLKAQALRNLEDFNCSLSDANLALVCNNPSFISCVVLMIKYV